MTRITEQLMKSRITELMQDQNEHTDGSGAGLESVGDNSEFVQAAFKRILGRPPELEALLHFSQVLEEQPRETFLEFLKQSDEARRRDPAPSEPIELEDLTEIGPDSAFLNAAYARVFGRVADPDGLAGYIHDLASGASRDQILVGLCCSPEGRARMKTMTLHGRDVEKFFEPPVEIPVLEVPPQQFEPVTLNVDELLNIDDPRVFLSAVYERAFGREPDPEGFEYWLSFLDRAKSKYSVLLNVSRQEETKLRKVTFHLNGAPIEQWDVTDLTNFTLPGRFVWEACKRMFRRDCSLEEFAPPRALLNHGVTRIDTLGIIALAPSAAGVPAMFYWQGNPLTAPELPFSIRLRAYLQRLWGLPQPVAVEYAMERAWAGQSSWAPPALEPVPDQGISPAIEARLEDIQSSIGSAQRSIVRLNEKLDTVRSEFKARVESLEHSLAATFQTNTRSPVLIGNDVFVTKTDDFILAIPREDWTLTAHYAYWGTLERGLVRRFQQTVRPGMTVVDVGANVGIYTLHAARLVGNTGRVFSFEPAVRTFDILRQNVEANSLSAQVKLLPFAVLDRSSTMPFYVQESRCGLNNLYGRESGRPVMVSTVSLDEALTDVTAIDVVKIDAEGSEPQILRGMRRIVTSNRGLQIFLEFGPSLLLRAGTEPSHFLDQILGMGFDIRQVDDETGELLPYNRASLLAAFSVNLSLRRTVA